MEAIWTAVKTQLSGSRARATQGKSASELKISDIKAIKHALPYLVLLVLPLTGQPSLPPASGATNPETNMCNVQLLSTNVQLPRTNVQYSVTKCAKCHTLMSDMQ